MRVCRNESYNAPTRRSKSSPRAGTRRELLMYSDRGFATPAGFEASRGGARRPASQLFQLDRRAGLLEFLLELVGLLAFDALLDGLRSLVDERLGLFQAEARGGANDLDHLD